MEQYHEVEDFFKDKDTKGYDKSLAQSLEVIKGNANWVARDGNDVKQWLKSHGYLK